ncbi:hypothetical protein BH23ACT9_BH23ACT9_28700 [soil metagenome]
MVAMQFRVLGSLEVRRGAADVHIGSRRQRTLLAALLAEAGRVVSVDALAGALWGEAQPADPRNAIQTYVARLRETLGDDATILTRAPGYLVQVEREQVDALRFEQLLMEARRRIGEPMTVRTLLDDALELWRGPTYAEFDDGTVRAEALRLDELRLVAIETYAAARLLPGEASELVGDLAAAVAAHPFRERLVALLMQVLATLDRQAEALAIYRRYRDRLADETGLEPSHDLRDLERRILRGERVRPDTGSASSRHVIPPQLAPTAVSRDAAMKGASDVPVTPTSVVGRETEVAAVQRLLDRERLVTMVGPGGVGKTRLAAEVARVIERCDLEVAWTELSSLAASSCSCSTTASTLRTRPGR